MPNIQGLFIPVPTTEPQLETAVVPQTAKAIPFLAKVPLMTPIDSIRI